ncbi:hypothetical protein ACFWFF_01510 [Streptomyces sp. NPDC060223]|uniref:hypothetical protein n=1 Tax=unclassified Streptomyces TaxID=2593676 RepID=UPI00362D2AE0
MSYFSLRKGGAEPEAEADGVDDEAIEPEPTDDEEPDAPRGAVGAVWAGISGPGRWLTARGRPGLAWLLYAGSAWACGFYGGWITVGVAAFWVMAVLFFVPREHLDRLITTIERRAMRPSKPAAAPLPGGELETVRGLLLDLIGEAHGVHLRTVLAHLQKHGQWEGRTVAELRVHLEALGVPVQPKVKVAGTPTRGVLRADLEALSPLPETSPSPAPSPPV